MSVEVNSRGIFDYPLKRSEIVSWIENNYDSLSRFLRAYISDSSSCSCLENYEDMVQEVFLKMVKGARRGGLKRIDKPRAYLKTAMRNLAKDIRAKADKRIRSKSYYEFGDDSDKALQFADEKDSSEQITSQETKEEVNFALNSLSHRHRETLHRHYFLDQTYTDIASDMNCPPNTVLTRMHYARKHLERELEECWASV